MAEDGHHFHHVPKVTQAALTKILPGEEDRFGK
jgi:hypothetical protein